MKTIGKAVGKIVAKATSAVTKTVAKPAPPRQVAVAPVPAKAVAPKAPVVVTAKGKSQCVACGGTGKNTKGGVCAPCKGTGVRLAAVPDGAVIKAAPKVIAHPAQVAAGTAKGKSASTPAPVKAVGKVTAPAGKKPAPKAPTSVPVKKLTELPIQDNEAEQAMINLYDDRLNRIWTEVLRIEVVFKAWDQVYQAANVSSAAAADAVAKVKRYLDKCNEILAEK